MSSLEAQLKDVAGEPTLYAALTKLGLLGSKEKFHKTVLRRDWSRGGAETFNLIFEVVTSKGSAAYLMKACVPFSPAIPIDRVLGQWLQRRSILEQYGVKVPHLYGVGRGTLIEELLPYDLAAFPVSAWTNEIKDQVFKFARVLAELKFAAVSPFSDLMTDRRFVYQVDFGSDLGDPYSSSTVPDYLQLANEWFKKLGV